MLIITMLLIFEYSS